MCNVIRRQVQSAYPDLRLFFVVHKENERAHTYIREKHSISDHPCLHNLQIHLETSDFAHKLLNQNNTEFSLIARQNSPGFAGLFKKDNYLALCFVNSDRFETEETLKNHIYHIVWHAIALYKNFIAKNNPRNKDDNDQYFSYQDNIIKSALSQSAIYEQNLFADIFSSTLQTLDGSEQAVKKLFMQRIEDTLHKNKGVKAENYPFPACLEQVEFAHKHSLKELSSYKNSILKAAAFTEDFIKSYDSSVINQWHDFAYPAQRMAWANHPPEVILGAALFTGEKTHIQSIADMISEHAHISSKNIIDLQDYNPFTVHDVNKRVHLRLCETITKKAIDQAFMFRDYKKLVKEAVQKNEELASGRTLGWCAFTLYSASKIFKHAGNETPPNELRTQIETEVKKTISELPWEVLAEFSVLLFKEIRELGELSLSRIKELASQDDKYIHIYAALSEEDTAQKGSDNSTLNKEQGSASNTSATKKNIRDFISPNAILK